MAKQSRRASKETTSAPVTDTSTEISLFGVARSRDLGDEQDQHLARRIRVRVRAETLKQLADAGYVTLDVSEQGNVGEGILLCADEIRKALRE